MTNPKAIAEALRVILEPGQVTELRALNAVTRGDRRPHVESGYFDAPDKLAEAAAEIVEASGIYFLPNPVSHALLARAVNRTRNPGRNPTTADHDVTARRWLLIDCDPVRPAGISSSDSEHAAAIQRAEMISTELHGCGFPWPILADSGNGAHLLYRVDLPADDGGLSERCLLALAAKYDDTAVKVDRAVSNPARIWKLYGTKACKGDNTPDRPHRMAKILNVPKPLLVVPREVMEGLAGSAPAPQARSTSTATTTRGGINESPETLKAYLEAHGQNVKAVEDRRGGGHVLILDGCPMNGDHGRAGDTAVVLLPDGMIGFECKHNGCQSYKWSDVRAAIDPDREKPKAPNPQRPTGANTKPPKKPAPSRPFTPFPLTALPEPARSFVKRGAQAIGCDPSFIALPLLAGLASAIGNSRRIQLKRTWEEPAIVWGVIVGDSGTLKSPAMELPLRPVRRRQHEAMKQYAQELQEYQTALAHYERALKEWGHGKGDGDPPERPLEPVAARCWCDDATVEALAVLLRNNWRGLLLVRDELAGWLGGFDRYAQSKGSDAPKWLEMHGGRPMVVDRRSGTPPMLYIDRASVSIAGGIQPETLRRALGVQHRKDGLLARLLLAYPPRRVKRWTEADISPEAEAELEALYDRLYALEPNTNESGDPVPVLVPLTLEGKKAWIDFFDAHAAEHADLVGDLSAAWSKLEGYAARLALVVHFIRWAADDPTLRSSDAVDAESVGAGVELSRWFGGEAERVYGVLEEDDDAREQRHLLERIARLGGTVTARELMRRSRAFARADEADAALAELVKAGLGRWEFDAHGGGPGRPARRFRLVDTADVDTNPENPQETGNCVKVNAVGAPAGGNGEGG